MQKYTLAGHSANHLHIATVSSGGYSASYLWDFSLSLMPRYMLTDPASRLLLYLVSRWHYDRWIARKDRMWTGSRYVTVLRTKLRAPGHSPILGSEQCPFRQGWDWLATVQTPIHRFCRYVTATMLVFCQVLDNFTLIPWLIGTWIGCLDDYAIEWRRGARQ
jgi:hypothetical protein